MKSIVILILAMVMALLTFSQENNSGKVVYEQIVKLEIKLEGDAAQYASMMPKERKSEKVLLFTPESSLFENNKQNDENMTANHGGGQMMVRMIEPENKIFTDLLKNIQIEQKEFMTRTFLIESEVKNQWKITGNQKMILNYPCQEATMGDSIKKVTAWFTPVIPVASGPLKFIGLPGLVLAAEIDGGKTVFNAKSIELTPVDQAHMVKPDKGKKVTDTEYKAIVDEKMKEMGAQSGPGSGTHMMIRIQR